ncbi:MAG: GAF domain-containing protein [Burkholderiales bacterium]|nr:GAF domain-containing protein [Burkholderiales bacterium]
MNPTPDEFQVTLANCDREPIHIPGRVQSHGVLVAFGAGGVVTHISANAGAILGEFAPALGQSLADTCFGQNAQMLHGVQECLRDDGPDVQPVALEVELLGRRMEMVAHRHQGVTLIELEPLPDDDRRFDNHAFQGHRALGRLRRQRTIEDLLAAAVQEVRRLTGFDRVMAYRFRHDDSGDVVVEDKLESLEPFAGRRYPASDIPAQARRLYVLNTLRNIVDVASPTVPLEVFDPEAPPLDMSHALLRGVSPVHIEYLTNMGVRASMSISIVINGSLWGMLACHHMQPHVVPYRVRTACDVLAQVLAANVQGLMARSHAARMESAASVRTQAIQHLLHADDGIFALQSRAQALCDMLEAQGLVLANGGRVAVHGGLPVAAGRALVAWLEEQATTTRDSFVSRNCLDDVPAPLRETLGVWCGFLAVRFAPASGGWLVALRKEQVETIAWGGRPEKEYVHGPMGTRLTPRGSFDVWKETVRGQCVPWNGADREIAQALLAELIRAASVRGAEVAHARTHLLSMLGVASGGDTDTAAAPAEASSAAGRLRHVVGQVLDASRLSSGTGFELRPEALDLSALVRELLDQKGEAYPDTRFVRELPRQLMLQGDAQRLRQLIQSLLSNARVHGAPGEPIFVQLAESDGTAVLDVSNTGDAIDPAAVDALFDPLRRPTPGERAGGLGLGLYIARSIARAHGGELDYAFADPFVVFSLTLPVQAAVVAA